MIIHSQYIMAPFVENFYYLIYLYKYFSIHIYPCIYTCLGESLKKIPTILYPSTPLQYDFTVPSIRKSLYPHVLNQSQISYLFGQQNVVKVTVKQVLHLSFERPCIILLSLGELHEREAQIGLLEGKRPCEAEINHEAETSQTRESSDRLQLTIGTWVSPTMIGQSLPNQQKYTVDPENCELIDDIYFKPLYFGVVR